MHKSSFQEAAKTRAALSPPREGSQILPGLALTVAIAGAAFALRLLPGVHMLSPLIIAILIGMAIRNLFGKPVWANAGIAFSLRRILRAGIVLLGLQLTLQQVIAVGGAGFTIITITLVATFAFATWLGRRLQVDAGLTQLIAAGSAICGASAVIATNTVTRARDEDVAYAVACVTIFGSLSMMLMPIAGEFLGMDAREFGLWTGSSIHEVAQVVAAAYAHGAEAGEIGTIAKLTRVMMMAPLVLLLGVAAARRARNGSQAGHAAPPVPWFVFGFIAMIGIASTGIVPQSIQPVTTTTTQFLLAVALAAMGLETDLHKLLSDGLRPALLGAGTWIFISLLSLALIALLT